MAEETKGEEVSPEEPAPAEGETKQDDKNGKNRRDYKRDETPIEELFDLSKPIPRVERPNKAEHEKELDELNNEIKSVQEQRQKVQDTIDKMMNTGKNSEISIQRDALGKLRSQKGALIEEKKKIFAKLDAIKSQGDKLAKDRKDTRANVKFHKLEDIEKEIQKLKTTQETTSMSLSDEKRLIKEMESLQASKSLVAELKSKETDLEDVKEQRKNIGAQISMKDKEIDEVQKQINERMDKIKALSEKETDKRDQLKELFTQRDELRKQMNEIFKKKDASRAAYREKNNDWYNFKRALAAQKKMEYEAEKKRREEEMAAWLKKKEEEEAKKIPYEEEQALCDYLADYLTRTYLTDKEAEAKKAAEEAEKKRQAGVVPVTDDPFAGFKPVQKKSGEEEYFGKGKGRKKRDRTKKKEEKAIAGPFTLNVDTFEQFALIGLNPPTTIDQVGKTVEELKAKKVWYSEQPRGSVPTATEIRKANEKAAAKLRSSIKENGGPEPAKAKATGDNFSLSNDDFVPLGSGTGSSSINSNWGQKSSPEEPANAQEAADAAAPAEEG